MTRPLKGIIADALESKGLTLEKLSSLAEVPLSHLTAIMEHATEKLPAFPYIRASLGRIAHVLGLDIQEVIAVYKEQYAEKLSGASDKLPGNRFAMVRPSRRWWYAVIVVVAILLYAVLNSGVFGTPYLQLENPPTSQDPYIVQTPSIALRGVVEPDDKVFINGQAIVVDEEGRFEKEYPLNRDLNTFEFRVQRFLGKELVVVRNIFYSPLIAEDAQVSTSTEEDVIE